MPADEFHVEIRHETRRTPRRILSIVSNTAELKGFPVGFFAEEMTRAFLAFLEAGHHVDIVSPDGGDVMFDMHSDPRIPDGEYADDLISLGFITHEKFGPMLQDTPSINHVDVSQYDAVWVAGGGGPLLTFKDHAALHKLIAEFYENEKVVSLICHGSSLLLWTRLSDGSLLSADKKWTGFTDEEEADVNASFGMELNDYTIESEAQKIAGTTFLSRGMYEPFAVRDGRLITGQQQYSSGLTAQMMLEALDEY